MTDERTDHGRTDYGPQAEGTLIVSHLMRRFEAGVIYISRRALPYTL